VAGTSPFFCGTVEGPPCPTPAKYVFRNAAKIIKQMIAKTAEMLIMLPRIVMGPIRSSRFRPFLARGHHMWIRNSLLFMAVVVFCAQVRADSLVLTAGATAAGFGLSTFASGFPTDSSEANGAVGPLGIAFVNNGVLVTDAPGNIRFFATDTDNQTIASASTVGTNLGHNNAVGLAQIGSTIYMTEQVNGKVVTVNPTPGPIGGPSSIVTSIVNATGIVTNPITGHLFVSTYNGNSIYDVNPSNGVTTLFTSAYFDGISTDGTTLFGADPGNGHIYGYNIANPTNVTDYGFINFGVPDGTALGTGSLAGNLFVNTNSGNVVELNLLTHVQTEIATGGVRGDFVAVDPNGTLLLTEQTTVYRLTAPSGGGFGSSTPLPPVALAGFVLLGVLGALQVRPKGKRSPAAKRY
jgi:hypothetical protein